MPQPLASPPTRRRYLSPDARRPTGSGRCSQRTGSGDRVTLLWPFPRGWDAPSAVFRWSRARRDADRWLAAILLLTCSSDDESEQSEVEALRTRVSEIEARLAETPTAVATPTSAPSPTPTPTPSPSPERTAPPSPMPMTLAAATSSPAATLPPATPPPPTAPPPTATTAVPPSTTHITTFNQCLAGWENAASIEASAALLRQSGQTQTSQAYAAETQSQIARLDAGGCRGIGTLAASEPSAPTSCNSTLNLVAAWESIAQLARLSGYPSQAAARALQELQAFRAIAC